MMMGNSRSMQHLSLVAREGRCVEALSGVWAS